MIYVFDDFELNTRLYTLHRAGQTTRLRPKVFQILLYLLEHRDDVVSKEELAEQVWPDQFISNSTLESTIRLLRRALGDSGRAQRIIQTSHGYGYRFVAPVSAPVETGAPDAPAPDEAWRCPTCQHVNAADTTTGDTICTECGTPLRSRCLHCGAENLPQANFCAACGASLTEPSVSPSSTSTDQQYAIPQDQPPPSTPASTERDMHETERRQLTVMVCDLVDAVTLPERLELEDLHDVMRAYQEMCADVVRRFDGQIAQNLGNRMLVYFGYPRAHEDDALRAVHTGLGIVEALQALNARLVQEKGIRLAVRLGIHTGLVLIGDLGGDSRHDALALGNTPNIATQIQDIAIPNTVVISAATAHLVQGYFACQDLGLHSLEGTAAPVQLLQVLGLSGAHSRLDIMSFGGLTPFVGRDAEASLLLERWSQVKEGRGHVILLSGEAGIGKSRLVQVMKERIAEEPYIQLECRCSPYHQQSALYPVIELFSRLLQWRHDDAPDEKFKKLELALRQYDVPLQEVVPLFAALLSLPAPSDRYPSLSLTPQQQRQKTLEAILAVVLALATQQPVLLIVEDLHWIDPSTLELLTLLINQTPTAPICALFTYRPAFEVPWGNRSYLIQITLTSLPRRQVEQMVLRITGGKPLPAEMLQQVLEKTDGVPLFVEELTKAVLETGLLREAEDRYELTTQQPSLDVPATLHDSLMARLDRLGSAKGIAQLGAVLGRRYAYTLILAVSRLVEAVLQRELEQLVKAELVYQQGLPPQATYVFKHTLIQETAYQSLLKSTRQTYHQQTAQALIEHFPETADLQPELLAYHYTEAGLSGQAIPYWQRAGQRAVERSANIEAISHFTKALELLKAFPETPEHIQQELTLQLALGSPLLILKGHAAPEVEHAYTRAYELAQKLGETPQRFSVLVGLWRFYFNNASLLTAQELAEQCFTLAQRLREPTTLQEAHQILGSTFFFMGDPVAAHTHLEQAIALYDPQQSPRLAFSRGTDPGVVSLSRLAWTLLWLGYPDRARARSHEAITLAQRLSHPYSQSFAIHYNAILHVWCREIALAKEQLEVSLSFMQEHGFVHFLGQALTKLGWALVEQGDIEEGVAKIRQGQEALQIHRIELGRSTDLAILAQIAGRIEHAKEGLRVLDQAFIIAHNNERFYEAELYRIKGELFLQLDVQEAESCFHQAISLARHQCAKSLELRAVISLSHLWQHQGKQSAARQMLAESYNWFTEGFDTPDLQEAKALLEALE